MRHCPHCGQAVTNAADRYCPHCGAALLQAAPAAQGSGGTARPYADPAAQRPPLGSSFASGGVSGVPLSTLPRNPTPVAPATGPGTSLLMGAVRSVVAMDMRGLLIMAAVVIAVIVAVVLVLKAVFFVLHLWWLWLILIAIAVYMGQRRRNRLP